MIDYIEAFVREHHAMAARPDGAPGTRTEAVEWLGRAGYLSAVRICELIAHSSGYNPRYAPYSPGDSPRRCSLLAVAACQPEFQLKNYTERGAVLGLVQRVPAHNAGTTRSAASRS